MRNGIVPVTSALIPLIITPQFLFYFDITPKLVVLLTGTAAALLLLPLDLRNLWSTRPGRWLVGVLVFEWLWLALATALSAHPVLSLNGTTWRRSGLIAETALLVFTLIAAGWLTTQAVNRLLLLRCWIASGAVIAVYAIAQYFGLDPFLPAKAYQSGEGVFTIVRPPGTLGHSNYLAAWLVLIVFSGPALRRIEHHKMWKRIASATACLSILAIFLSGTRSALVGLLSGAMLWLVLERPRFSRQAILLGTAGAAGLAVLVWSPAGLKLRARIHWSIEDLRGGARLLLWRDSLRVLAAHPLTGLGPENFGTEFPRYQSVELARAYPDFYHESPHNLFLDVAGNAGLPALIALLTLSALAVAAAYGSSSPMRVPLLAGFAAFLVCQQFTVFTLATETGFYLMAALLISMAKPMDAAERTWRVPAVLRFAAAFGLLAFALSSILGDRWLLVAQEQARAGNVPAAAEAYRQSIRWRPSGLGADLAYSRQMASLAAYSPNFRTRLDGFQQALDSGIRATRESEDRQNAWYNLATLMAAQNDTAGVERSLRNAILWAPNWFKPHWTLAQLLDLQHRQKEALVEARAAVDRDGGRDAEVLATWTKLTQMAR